MARGSFFSGKNKLFLQILILCLVVLGLSAGVIIVSSKNTVLNRSRAQAITAVYLCLPSGCDGMGTAVNVYNCGGATECASPRVCCKIAAPAPTSSPCIKTGSKDGCSWQKPCCTGDCQARYPDYDFQCYPKSTLSPPPIYKEM